MDFHQTVMGNKFFTYDLPNLINQLEIYNKSKQPIPVEIDMGVNKVDGLLIQWNSDGSGLIQIGNNFGTYGAGHIKLKEN